MSFKETPLNIDDIWAGDLLGRREEAADIIGYLESVATRPSIREDGHAHVLAVDCGYGLGKTFFLRRLRSEMSLSHPVAFVDAWVDDLQDEPMVALASTLEDALSAWSTVPKLDERLRDFREKAGRVAKIVGTGLTKRALGFLITQGAAELLVDTVGSSDDLHSEINKELTKSFGDKTVDNAAAAFEAIQPDMEQRIKSFKRGQRAIADMRNALAAIVSSIATSGATLPITIIIDELDRCRPTYAIKLLEEIKHLFDVQGVAFVLGMHGAQLEHSIRAAYGIGFDSGSYLRRFFNRRYVLRPVALTPLIDKLIQDLGIDPGRLEFPNVTFGERGENKQLSAAEFISLYLQHYDLQARDAFSVIESIEVFLALVRPSRIHLDYLLPLMMTRMTGTSIDTDTRPDPSWSIVTLSGPRYSQSLSETKLGQLAKELHRLALMSDRDARRLVNSEKECYANEVLLNTTFSGDPTYANAPLRRYGALLETTKRFK